MDSLDYKQLYALQDEVLEVVFSVENIFYLTGGTCLSRFYKEKRYSDDLDFFTNGSPRYSFALKKAGFSDEELIIRLKSFPPSLFKEIKLIDKAFLDNFDKEFSLLLNEIQVQM